MVSLEVAQGFGGGWTLLVQTQTDLVKEGFRALCTSQPWRLLCKLLWEAKVAAAGKASHMDHRALGFQRSGADFPCELSPCFCFIPLLEKTDPDVCV